MSYRFLRSQRLLKTDEFSSVFRSRSCQNIAFALCYTKPNGLGYPRLGLAVSKKVHKHAVARNYMKRALRNWFRINQNVLLPCDYVLVVKTAFDSTNLHLININLSSLFQSRKTL